MSSLDPRKPYETISPVLIKDNKFYLKDNSRFFLKGIAYQQERSSHEIYSTLEDTSYIDPLKNITTCMRDIKNFETLGLNLIRIYQIDPTVNHDACMNALARKQIYVLLDLAEPEMSINRDNPQWTTELMDRYTSVVDSMAKYNNIMGFVAGNEVTNSKLNTNASPFVKAAIRDIKRYISNKGYRQIPIGYATNDDADIRMALSEYFVCHGQERDSSADFLGINMYEWCGHSTFATSGYRDRTLEYSNFPVPLFFSEFGCNAVTNGRPFTEIDALYSSAMTSVWSGGIVYSYFEYENHYGIVKESNGTLIKLKDFNTLSDKYTTIQPKIGPAENIPIRQVKCPLRSANWNATFLLPPTPNSRLCECMQTAYDCIFSPFKKEDVDLLELLARICDQVDCKEINAEGSIGKYGALSGCTLKQKISYALNLYYHTKGKNPTSCDFDGNAILVQGNKNLSQIFMQDGNTCDEVIGRMNFTRPLFEINDTTVIQQDSNTNESQYLDFKQFTSYTSSSVRLHPKRIIISALISWVLLIK